MLIGALSDTHGVLDPAISRAFAGVDRILHAGDVGDQAILRRLASVAPVVAVRGNCDNEPWGLALPSVASDVFDGARQLRRRQLR